MRMVEEGALNGLDAVFGLHVDPSNPVGTVGTRSGPMMASADTFELIIHGSGGHAARPHFTIDPIALSAHVINAIQQVVSRRLNPLDPGVITIGTIHGGTVSNVIPDTVTMTGTIRAFSQEGRATLLSELERACKVIEPLGARIEYTLQAGYPPTVNSPEATAIMLAAATDLLGADQVKEAPMVMGAEDFSFMAQVAPGNFLRIGTHNPAWDRHYPVHRADFRLDEDALPVGAAALAAAAIRWMQEKG
jgi:amidohydrolase